MKTNASDRRKRSVDSGWPVRSAAVVLAVCFVVAGGASTAGAAGMLIAEGGLGGVLEIESHEVVVTINNGIAVTEVTQVFVNTEERQVEALYTFPVPKGASVADFSMWIAGKEMVGEVVEKTRAREIYESYKATRRDPGLLEQTNAKTFEMRIFPINAGARQKVRICYYQEMDYDNDWVTYVYPLATVAGSRASKTTGKFSFALHAKSGIPITQMESPSHGSDIVMVNHAATYREASMETTGGDLNKDIVLAYKLQRPRTGVDVLCAKPTGEDGYFCLTLTAGQELADKAQPMDYVFVLDISGSMADESKLAISRRCITAFIAELDEKDRFEIITFNASPQTLLNKLSPLDDGVRAQAKTFLDSRRTGGGTVLRPALLTAYKYRDKDRPLNVVIFSDGMTEQGERDVLVQTIRNQPSNVRVFCVGVGNEVNRPLLRQLADQAGGLAAFLSQGDDFARQAKAFHRKLAKPCMRNVKITFDGAGVHDVEPLTLPNLYHGAPIRLYGRFNRSQTVTVKVTAEIDGSAFEKTTDLTFDAAGAGNPEIVRMWAWSRVQRLERLIDDPAGKPGAIEEIVRLGEGYSIATQWTSFIVLENDAEYKRWSLKRTNALRIKGDRAARQKLMTELESMRDEALAGLGPQVEGTATSSRTASTPPVPPRRSSPPSSRRRSFPGFRFGGGPVGVFELAAICAMAGAIGVAAKRRRNKRCR